SKWDGAPTVRFLRWRDPTFDFTFKEKMRELLKKQFKITLISKEMEERNPVDGDTQISAAFLQVKSFLYRNDPEGPWKKHNMEYGFNRNLVGSRGIWLILSIVGTASFAFLWMKSGENLFLLGMVLNTIEMAGSIIVGW